MNTIGTKLRLTLTGASHAPSVGCVLEGIPKGIRIDMDAVRFDLSRRSAASYALATPRHEADEPLIDSGISDGVTDGGPIAVTFPNRAFDRSEYRPIARPSHADYCAFVKSGGREDISGGGRYSGRMTLPLTFAGSVARQVLASRGIEIFSHVSFIGGIADAPFDPIMTERPKLDPFFPLVDSSKRGEMEALLRTARESGDTLSCGLECAALGLPVGLGEPLFDGLEGVISRYLFMIPGLRGVEFGERLTCGSEMNDQFTEGGRTLTNHSGGVNGGMANGMPLVFRVRFRPVPSISLPQTGYDLIEKKPAPLTISGRHDTAILPRGAVAVEAAAAIGILDLMLRERADGDEGLEAQRARLDTVDADIMRLFSERMEVSKEIGRIKRTKGLPIEVPEREAEVVSSRLAALPEEYKAGGEGLVRLLMDESKKIQRRGLNLYLVGMPSSGKTGLGEILQKTMDMPLSDTDRLIMTEEARSIDGIFAELGEEFFRGKETEWLRALANRGGLIVATGGGAPMRGENVDIMKGSGRIVFLDRALEKLHGQSTVNRPLLAAGTPEETDARIDRLYCERRDKYLACADLTVDPDEEGAAERIAEWFEEERQ